MDERKEVQVKIIKEKENKETTTEEEFFNVLKQIAPGTNLRTALEGAQRTGKGALIVVENEKVPPLIDGGFRINSRFTPQRLIELTKMDGAIILSKDIKKINYANVLLTPENKIKTTETGTRHKAAERTAKQTGSLVIAISERKNEITLYYKNIRYPIRGTDDLLRKANEHVQMLEKQRELFDQHAKELDRLEIRNHLNLGQAINVIQKGRFIQKISEELKKYAVELGKEGTLIRTRLRELTIGVEKEMNLVIKDYTKLDLKKSRVLLDSLTYDELLDKETIQRILAHESPLMSTQVKGWRILSKTSLHESEIAQIVKESGSLGKAIHSNSKFYETILGKEKGEFLKEEIEKIKLGF